MGITVVLAAVLYIEVSNLTRAGASTPYAVGMVFSKQVSATSTYFDFGTLVTTSGLSTSMFGLKVIAPGGLTYGMAPGIPGTCASGTTNLTPTMCSGVSGGWYGLLISGTSGAVAATYSSVGWTYVGGTSNLELNDGYSLIVVTPLPVAGAGDIITVFGTGSSSVSGEADL